MRLKRRIFNLITNTCIRIFNLNKANKISTAVIDKINPYYKVSKNGIDYIINCPNSLIMWRAETYFTKEPDTIKWIDSFNEQDVLFDIGANIGLYTIYAAKKGNRVLAFEPEAQNYSELNTNVYLNEVQKKVLCLNLALSNNNAMGRLFIPTFSKGSSLSNVGKAVDWRKKAFKPEFEQSVIIYTLDSLIKTFKAPFPTHIKIDVDGLESQIIAGAQKTLSNPRLKSVLIELNESLDEDLAIIETLESYGLQFCSKYHHPMFDGTEYESVYNYTFFRR